jgi:hypothetical protein
MVVVLMGVASQVPMESEVLYDIYNMVLSDIFPCFDDSGIYFGSTFPIVSI